MSDLNQRVNQHIYNETFAIFATNTDLSRGALNVPRAERAIEDKAFELTAIGIGDVRLRTMTALAMIDVAAACEEVRSDVPQGGWLDAETHN